MDRDLFGAVEADPFESCGEDPMIAINAAKQLAADSVKDPERSGVTKTTERVKKGKASRALGHTLSNKAVAEYSADGFMAFRVDYTIAIYGGGMQTMDLLGIGDVLAVKPGRMILSQCTVAEKRTDHERKLCDDVKRIPRVLKTVYQLALEWLDHGGEIEMRCYSKDARGHWQPEVFSITREWLMARKEKLEQRRRAA